MKKLYFVRHGLSVMNINGLVAGSSETPLSSEGKKQAKLAGVSAKKLKVDCIVSSPQTRAIETAKIIASEINYPKDKIITNKLFAERHFGELEGKPWSPNLELDGVSDIETKDDLLERAKLAFQFLSKIEADNILVVAHGSIGRAIRHYIDPNYPFENRSSHSHKLHNGQIVEWI